MLLDYSSMSSRHRRVIVLKQRPFWISFRFYCCCSSLKTLTWSLFSRVVGYGIETAASWIPSKFVDNSVHENFFIGDSRAQGRIYGGAASPLLPRRRGGGSRLPRRGREKGKEKREKRKRREEGERERRDRLCPPPPPASVAYFLHTAVLLVVDSGTPILIASVTVQ